MIFLQVLWDANPPKPFRKGFLSIKIEKAGRAGGEGGEDVEHRLLQVVIYAGSGLFGVVVRHSTGVKPQETLGADQNIQLAAWHL